jgi:Mg2+/Co2+ transporter CorB
LENISIPFLLVTLIFLILFSGFFSGSEIGMMSLNRYRLRHLVKKGDLLAKQVSKLLERPDRLLGVILIGNTFANIAASAIGTIIAVRLWGEIGVVIGSIFLTLIILIFAEIAPKTFAAGHPMRFLFLYHAP